MDNILLIDAGDHVRTNYLHKKEKEV